MNEREFEEQLQALSERVLSKALTPEEETSYTESLFESIRHINEYGEEFWYARELQIALEYKEWRNFAKVIDKAKSACEGSDNVVSNHFVDVTKMVNIGSGAERKLEDIQLSRYACYLIVQNSDPRKKVIALGQSYFAIKTRQQELIEHFDDLDENAKRLAIRQEMIDHNKMLVAAAKDAGVETAKDYAIFQNHGYKGLYGGLGAKEIHERKGLGKNDKILDHMGYEELAANLFRATQAESKLRRENIQGKENANKTHYNVGKEVRKTIEKLGGTMPEDLPTPSKSIQQLKKEQKEIENRSDHL
ncbi:MAG: DNA damage-inducible protein D [Lachnospiraceae bacterium]|nr:DNA damage-inducible protein D [Lachnospiraceae bacterium]